MQNNLNRKKQRLAEIKSLVQQFCQKYLNDEYQGYAFNLCDALGRKRKIDISRGEKKIWAAAVVYVIGQLNFLFNKNHEWHIAHDTINEFFDTSKNTVGTKASAIEKACNLSRNIQGFCSPEIEEAYAFFATPAGALFPGDLQFRLMAIHGLVEKNKKE